MKRRSFLHRRECAHTHTRRGVPAASEMANHPEKGSLLPGPLLGLSPAVVLWPRPNFCAVLSLSLFTPVPLILCTGFPLTGSMLSSQLMATLQYALGDREAHLLSSYPGACSSPRLRGPCPATSPLLTPPIGSGPRPPCDPSTPLPTLPSHSHTFPALLL